ncbi:MAG: lactonase family protein [Cyclobacteriaceae bacterium]
MNLLIGCYTRKISEEILGGGKGIYCFDFDQDMGKLNLLDIVPALNPSYLAVSSGKQFLYTVEEIEESGTPHVSAYAINRNERPHLRLINKQKLEGSYACHLNVSFDGKFLLVANYGSGNVNVYPIRQDGGLEVISDNVYHEGNGPNAMRQEAPRAHMISKHGDQLFVPDLGIDQVKSYRMDVGEQSLIPVDNSDMATSAGAGPRHIVFHSSGNYAFVIGELDSRVYVFKNQGETFSLIQTIDSLPKAYKEVPSGSAIRIHPKGKFLYVANRGFNHLTIFDFDIKNEILTLSRYESTRGETPREFNIDPSGKWLLAANQDSHSISVFKIDQKNGTLRFHELSEEAASPSCVLWI